MAEVISGEGTTFSIDGEVVAQVTTITGYSGTRPAIDTTHLTTSGARTYRAGKLNYEPVSGEGWFDPNDESHEALEALLASGEKAEIVITYQTSPATTYTWEEAILTNFSVTGMDLDSNVTFSFEFQPSGDPVKATAGGGGGGGA